MNGGENGGEYWDENRALDLHEVCRIIHVEEDWMVELVHYGIVEPEGRSRSDWRFRLRTLSRIRCAARLQHDLGVNLAGIGVVLDLLDEMDRLRRALRRSGPPS